MKRVFISDPCVGSPLALRHRDHGIARFLAVVLTGFLCVRALAAREVPPDLLALERQGMRVGAAFALNGRVVAAHRADEPMNPASVTKVFTAALALAVLGADASVETRVVATGEGAARRVLAVIGGGDPMLEAADLRDLARCVRKAGVSEVGRLVVDTGPFNSDALPPAYDQKNTDAPYRAGVGGLQVNFNRLLVHVVPTRPGAPPDVRVEPDSSYVRVQVEAVTATPPKKRAKRVPPLRVTAEPDPSGGLLVRVSGSVTGRAPIAVATRVPQPATHAGHVFRASLSEAGVRVVEGPAIARAPEGAVVLCAHRSPPVRAMLIPMLKESQNQVAESLLRLCGAANASGRPVGFAEGAEALRKFLIQKVGLPAGAFQFQNGSGLYDANRVSARAVVHLLEYARSHPEMAPLLDALPVAARDGTMKNRFKNTPLEGRLRAKTGTLDRAVSLAGTVELDPARTLTFAILVEGDQKIPVAAVRRAMDRAIVQIANATGRSTRPARGR